MTTAITKEYKTRKVKKVVSFEFVYKENYERVALALAMSGYLVKITNGDNGQKVVEIYQFN